MSLNVGVTQYYNDIDRGRVGNENRNKIEPEGWDGGGLYKVVWIWIGTLKLKDCTNNTVANGRS